MIVQVRLSRTELVAIVDRADAERVLRHSWYLSKPSRPGASRYAMARVGGRLISMARLIVGAFEASQVVKYASANTLDNRRVNLRVERRVADADVPVIRKPAWYRHLEQYGANGPRVQCPTRGEMAPQRCEAFHRALHCGLGCAHRADADDLVAIRHLLRSEPAEDEAGQ